MKRVTLAGEKFLVVPDSEIQVAAYIAARIQLI